MKKINLHGGGEMENKKEGKKPKYIGNREVAVWENIDKYGNTYLSIKIDGQYVNCFEQQEDSQ